MNWFQRMLTTIFGIASKVFRAVAPALKTFVAQQATLIIDDVRAVVGEAETQFPGFGNGQQKYDWVVSQLKARLGQRLGGLPMRAVDLAIHLAVAELPHAAN